MQVCPHGTTSDFQRTHRERKEMYIKALEQEVLRLKETFQQTTQQRDAYAAEIRRLQDILRAHGIQFDSGIGSPGQNFGQVDSSYDNSNRSLSGSYGPGTVSTGFTSPPAMPSRPPPGLPNQQQIVPPGGASAPGQEYDSSQMQQPGPSNGLDYDQIGIDFVLTYDKSPYLTPPHN